MDKKIPWETYAESKIREAQQQGKFDDIPGLGKPISSTYLNDSWIKSWLKRNNLSLGPEQARRFLKD